MKKKMNLRSFAHLLARLMRIHTLRNLWFHVGFLHFPLYEIISC